MSKSISLSLFQLIRSLNRSEKRYFKIHAARHVIGEGNKYVELFDAIDKQRTYNDKALSKNKGFGKQLSSLKNNLYEKLLQCLHVYHSNSSIDAKLAELSHQIEILFEKGLYVQCERILKKARQLAEHYEYHWYQVNLLLHELYLMEAESYKGKTEEEIGKFFLKLFETTDNFKDTQEYRYAYVHLIVRSMRTGYPRVPADLESYKAIMYPLLQDKLEDKKAINGKWKSEVRNQKIKKDKLLSYHSARLFYFAKMYYHYVYNDYVNASKYARELVALMEQLPHQIKEKPTLYITALHSLIVYLHHLKKYDESFGVIEKLKNISPHSEQVKETLFWMISTAELGSCIATGQFDKGIILAKEFQYKLDSNQEKIIEIQDQTVLYYNMACIYFGGENYVTAQKYINIVTSDTVSDLRTDLHCFARIVNMIIQFELGKQDLLEYTVLSTYRYLYKRKHLYQLEASILNFIRKKLPEINSQKQLMVAFKKLKTELEEIFKNPFERKALDYFDFISWLDSKVEGRTFAEVVKEKVISQ